MLFRFFDLCFALKVHPNSFVTVLRTYIRDPVDATLLFRSMKGTLPTLISSKDFNILLRDALPGVAVGFALPEFIGGWEQLENFEVYWGQARSSFNALRQLEEEYCGGRKFVDLLDSVDLSFTDFPVCEQGAEIDYAYFVTVEDNVIVHNRALFWQTSHVHTHSAPYNQYFNKYNKNQYLESRFCCPKPYLGLNTRFNVDAYLRPKVVEKVFNPWHINGKSDYHKVRLGLSLGTIAVYVHCDTSVCVDGHKPWECPDDNRTNYFYKDVFC